MVRGITFSEQMITSADFAHFMHTFLNGSSGITKGCGISNTNAAVFVQKGYFIAFGRMVQIVGTEEIAAPDVLSGKLYCKVVFEIDLSKENTAESFTQGAFRVLTSTSAYPEPTQQDLDNGGTLYQMPWCQYEKTESKIEAFRDLRNIIDLESIWSAVSAQNGQYKTEFDAYFASQKTTVEGLIADLEAEGYVTMEEYRAVKQATLTVSEWTGTAAPYEQEVSIAGITADDVPVIGIIYPSGCTRAQQKAINKAANYIYDIETGAGTVTFRCTEKPVTEITIGLKGVM